MFSSTVACSSDVPTYDFEENAHKWKKVFISSLEKMLESQHPNLNAGDDALEYLEDLMVHLLSMLCAPPAPHTVQDLEVRVLTIFPSPLNRWAISDAQTAVEKNKKKNPTLMLPTDRVHPLLKDALQSKIDMQVTVYTMAILEYVSIDILRLVGIYLKDINSTDVTQKDIRTAMCADKVLMDMLSQSDRCDSVRSSVPEPPPVRGDVALTYDQLVKDLIEHEKANIRELNMIAKVFRNKLLQIPSVRDCHRKTLDEVFSNIDEIYDFSVNLLGSLEDTIEVTKENEPPAIGSCFEELAEGAEFDVYLRYVNDVVPRDRCQAAVQRLVRHPEVWEALGNGGEGFRDAVLYCLPRLLHTPVLHIFSDLKYIEELTLCAEACGDSSNKESLEQVQGLLCPLFSQLERIINAPDSPLHLKKRMATEVCIRAGGQVRRQAALQKLNETQRCIEGWEGRDIAQCCNHLVLEGDLKLGYPGKKQSDRHVFLFDGLMVLCKQKIGGYRFKEKYIIKSIDIVDKEDTDDGHHAFEIVPHGQQSSALLMARGALDKNNWMAALVIISTRNSLERQLDSILQEEERQHPLRLPDPALYPFSVADSEENIIIEERENSATPLIKGATLTKLLERLTYHMYADPMFVRTFLTTFRSFCTPTELLELLKKRFAIPELDCPEGTCALTAENGCVSSDGHDPANALLLHREGLKRFRKEYAQPIQFRVLNVLRHWVDYHFYDFDRDEKLLENLTQFLESVQGKSMRKWVVSITKIIQRKCNEETREITISQNCTLPSPKYHVRLDDKDWETILLAAAGGSTTDGDIIRPLLVLHPIEIARQLTLIEFDLYRSVKPSELVGKAWTKSDKEKRSPNLLKMIHHTNNVIWWVMRCIVECENFEERVAAMSRVVEVMIMFHDLNNFCGLFEMSSALESAAVHRMDLTKAEVKRRLPPAQKVVYEESMELGKNHFQKYLEKLRSINPPCVPFLGIYLTNIMHIEVGNPDSLPPHNLVNFSKRRKFAEITGEIQQYQNQAYCLQTEPKIRHFFETLMPYEGMDSEEINTLLYNRSTVIEPKNNKRPLVKERRFPQLSLKSPGIKPRSNRTVPNPLPAMFASYRDSSAGLDVTAGGDDTPHLLTPPTPSTPCTPPANTTPTASIASATSNSFTGFSGNSSMFGSGSSTTSGIFNSSSSINTAGGSATTHSSSLLLASSGGVQHAGTLPHWFRSDRCADQEDSVFARVEIGAPVSGLSRPSVSLGSDGIPPPLPPLQPLSSSAAPPPHTPGPLTGGVPPPLPPRSTPRQRETSLGDTSPKVQQAPDAPELPPRDVSPPPIPPRTNTLPHKHPPHPPSAPTTLSAPSSLPPHSTHFPYTPAATTPPAHSTSATTAATLHSRGATLPPHLHHHLHHHPPPPPPHHQHHHHVHHHHPMATPPPTFVSTSLHTSITSSSSPSHTSSSNSISHTSICSMNNNSNSTTMAVPMTIPTQQPTSQRHHNHLYGQQHHHHYLQQPQQQLSSPSPQPNSNTISNSSSYTICSTVITSNSNTGCVEGRSSHVFPPSLPPPIPTTTTTTETVATRRRNNSVDLTAAAASAAPPLARRYTTNGPPHGLSDLDMGSDSPPTPPPRLQTHIRPPLAFPYDVQQQQHL